MTPEDAEVARNVRRELGKRPIDSTLIEVQVKNGNVTLSGRLAHKRDNMEINLRSEIDVVMKMITRDRLVRGFFDQMHYVVNRSDGDDGKERNSRGRMRS